MGGLLLLGGGPPSCGTAEDAGTNSGSAGNGGEEAGLPDVSAPETSGAAGAGGTAGADADGDAGSDFDGSGAAEAGTVPDSSADGVPDSSTDDAEPDGPTEGPVSTFCGDGIRDAVLEECDDGTGVAPPDSCSADCRVQDVLVVPGASPDGGLPAKQVRHLGLGRHPVAAGATGFAVVFVDTSSSTASVVLRAFDPNGVPGALVAVASGSGIFEGADPVVAALPGGKYAVSYTDLNQDGDKQGIALRVVDPAGPAVGPVVRVNSPALGNQRDPESIWTGSELVVAYLDEGQLGPTATDVRLRRLSETGAPKAAPELLAGTNDFEGKASLVPFAGGFAAAWVALAETEHKVLTRAGSKTWSITMPPPSDAESQPMLAEIDAKHLLLVYVQGGGAWATPRLRGALIDTTVSASPTSFAIAPLVEPYASDPTLAQTQPALVRVGERLFVAWRSQGLPNSVALAELWLKEMKWSVTGGTLTLDLSSSELRLPRVPAHADGNQAYPALAGTPLVPGGAIASAWEDHGRVFGSIEGTPDVIGELIPVPVVRLASEGGLE